MPKSRPRQRKPIPSFRSERGEREFWETHDTTDYVDWSQGRIIRFSNLKPTTTTISLRLPAPLLADLKALANKRDVPYQSLLKIVLAERVAQELRSHSRAPANSTLSDSQLPLPCRTSRWSRPAATREFAGGQPDLDREISKHLEPLARCHV